MKRTEATCCAAILAALAAIHVYWAGGGQALAGASVPSRSSAEAGDSSALFEPGPVSTLAVAAALAAAAAFVLRAGFVGRNRGLAHLVSLAFFLRAVGEFRYAGWSKKVRGTEFARRDDLIYSPLCLVVSALARGAAK